MSVPPQRRFPRRFDLRLSWPPSKPWKGLTLSSRGQGHAFCARRPRVASLVILPTLRSDGSAPPGLSLTTRQGL